MIAFMEFGNPLPDSCDIESFSVGMTVPAHAHGIPRRAQIHDLTAEKASDYLTGVLLQHCAAGTRIDAVALEVYASEDSQKPILTYILKDVLIVSVICGVASPSDQFNLNAKSRTVRYLTS